MLKYLVICLLIHLISCGKNLHGEENMATLSQEERDKLKPEIRKEMLMDVEELIKMYGYESATYDVQTEDGYVLTVHRLLYRDRIVKNGSIPVLLEHGMMSSASDWIIDGPQRSLGYMLLNSGYDVWMGNARGNFYSQKHISLKPSDPHFWDFSWHEIGYYDLPAMIDFILNATGNDRLNYVGHSQGTTSFFVMASLRPEYNGKIISMHALSPVAYFRKNLQLEQTFKYLHDFDSVVDLYLESNKYHTFSLFPLMGEFCKNTSQFYYICVKLHNGQFDLERLPIYLGQFPSGFAFNQVRHYSQVYASKTFHLYDHGKEQNIKLYGAEHPPLYPLHEITVRNVLYYSMNDDMATEEQAERLSKEFNNTVELYRVPFDLFTHENFIYAIDIYRLLYGPLIEKMKALER